MSANPKPVTRQVTEQDRENALIFVRSLLLDHYGNEGERLVIAHKGQLSGHTGWGKQPLADRIAQLLADHVRM